VTRRLRPLAIVTAIALCAVPGAGIARERAHIAGPHVPHEVLVRFASHAAQETVLRSVRGRIVRSFPEIGFHLVRTTLDVPSALATLRRSRAVAVAEPNGTGTLALQANDPCLNGCNGGRQWNVAAVNAPAGWSVVPGRFYTATTKRTDAQPPIKVAVLDTKIDEQHGDWINAAPLPVNHPQSTINGGQLDLNNERDFLNASEHTGPADYHGTFVAGILGAATNNGSGMAGLAYRAEIVPIAVVNGSGVVTAANLAAGILYARDLDVRVINLSLGLHETSTAVSDAIDLATADGALVVAAAGNNGDDRPFYPAWHNNVMAVAGVDEADRRAPCSNYNGLISVAAPGMNILSMDPRTPSGYSVAGCGTSTATPHVSALAALLFAQDPVRTPAQVRAIIERTADDDRYLEGRDNYFGEGRINFERALREGEGPTVDRVIASVPRALGGTSKYRAVATATSARPILQAEWFVDQLGAPGNGSVVFAADGEFGELDEDLTVDVQVPLGFPSGVHRLFIRARDALGWGAASVGVLVVDRNPPKISRFEISPAAAATAGMPVEMTIEAGDDYAITLGYRYAVVDRLTDAVLYESEWDTFSERLVTQWMPPIELRGAFTIKLTVTDDGQNPARAEARTIVV
jgi:thermitase